MAVSAAAAILMVMAFAAVLAAFAVLVAVTAVAASVACQVLDGLLDLLFSGIAINQNLTREI